MRPLRIEAEGFTAFRRRIDISFEDADLFALVGPTGAGKSSVIDAMVFALYGKVPRYQDDRAVAPVINAQSAEARVRLDFEIGHEPYSAVRVVRRTKGGATTKEARLEHRGEVLAGDARGLDDAIANLLGLTFEQFTKTVVLPQGDFARFLHERPADRQDLLVRLLDLGVYGVMASLARERAKTHVDRLAILDDEVVRIGAVDATTAPTHRARAVELVAFAEELRDELTHIERLDQRLDDIRLGGETRRARQRALSAVGVPDEVRDHQHQLDDATRLGADALAAVERAREAADTAAAVLAGAPDEVAVRELRRSWDRLAELTSTERDQRAALAQRATEADASERALAAATVEAATANHALERAQDRSRAAALRHELHTGEPCPVCEQVVAVVPAPVPDRELDDARTALRRVAKRRDEAQVTHDRAERERTRLDDELAARAGELKVLGGVLASSISRAECDEALTRATAARAADLASRKALQAAEVAHRDATSVIGRLDDRGRELRRELTVVRDTFGDLGPPSPGERDLLADWSTLVEWCVETSSAFTVQLEALLVEHGEVRAARDTRSASVRDACEAHDVDATRPRLLEHVAQLVARADSDADTAHERFQRLQTIVEQVERHRAEQRVAEDLAKLLGANGFQQWLLEEALDDLVAGASVRLNALSSGQFSLERDGKQFVVRDHRNADDLRSVRTLSGGETFLASLALALALADNVAALSSRGAPHLESMFLDEGFGSLDPETLDVVAAAIEELGASGRMVGVVTHIRDLADRLPVRYEVTKLPDTSIVERVDR